MVRNFIKLPYPKTYQSRGIDLPQILTYATIDMVIIIYGIPHLICDESKSLSHDSYFHHILLHILKSVR